MSSPALPRRWLEALPEGDPLRTSLRAARDEKPAPADLERLYASVLVRGGGGEGDGSGGDAPLGDGSTSGAVGAATDGAGSAGQGAALANASAGSAARAVSQASSLGQAAGSGAIAKSLVIGLFGVASVSTALWIGSEDERATVMPALSASAPSSQVPRLAPPPPAIVEEAPQPSASSAGIASPTAGPSTSRDDDDVEMSLLREASSSISADPGRALSLVDEAERRFPRGPLAQEREVIRIQALIAAGRRDDAVARARAVLARNPASAHGPRLEQLLPELADR